MPSHISLCIVALCVMTCAHSVDAAMRPRVVSVPMHKHVTRAAAGAGGGQHVPLQAAAGEYAVTIGLGTPPQELLVILDSGSSTLAVPSFNCTGCTVAAYFNRTASPTAQPLLCSDPRCQSGCAAGPGLGSFCGFSISYGDGSGVEGARLTDTLTIGSLAAPSTGFGLFYAAQAGFQTPPAAGIMGVAYESNNCLAGDPNAGDSDGYTCYGVAFRQLLLSNGLPDVFATCMGTGNASGAFTMGGTDPLFYYGTILYSPVIQETYYTVWMLDLTVAGVSVGEPAAVYNNGGAIIDTGTTNLVVPEPAYTALKQVINGLAGCPLLSNSQCCEQSAIAVANLTGTVSIVLSGVSLSVPFSALIDCSASSGCPAGTCTISGISSNPANQGTIIGQTVLQQYYTVFDREAPRVGFAAANCQATCSRFNNVCGNCTASPSCMYCPADGTCRSRTSAETCSSGQHFMDGVCSLPVVTGVTPHNATACGGSVHILTGTGLSAVSSVAVGTTPAAVILQTASSIVFIAPTPQHAADCSSTTAPSTAPISLNTTVASAALAAGSLQYMPAAAPAAAPACNCPPPAAPLAPPGPSGVAIAAMIVALVAGVLSFGGLLYVWRWRRESHPLYTLADM